MTPPSNFSSKHSLEAGWLAKVFNKKEGRIFAFPPRRVWEKEIKAYTFLLPALVFLTVVYFYPILRLIPMSFQRIAVGESVWVGLSNYRYLIFQDPVVKIAITNNLKLLLGIPLLIGLAALISILLYEKVRGSGFYQSMILVPYLLSIPVVGLVMRAFLRFDGAFNTILQGMGLEVLALDWLGKTKLALWVVLAVIIWHELGMGVAFFLAELMGVDNELYDAAKVDGCSWFQQSRYITIPLLRNIMLFYTIFLVITFFSWTFGYVYVMTTGGPGFSTTVTEYAIYQFALDKHVPHMAATLSLMLFFALLVMVWAQFRIRKTLAEE